MTRQQPVNFLPTSYRRRVRQSRRNRRQAVLAVALLAVLAGWWFVQQQHTTQMQRQAQELEAEVESARQRMSELMALREQYQALRHQVRVQRLLSEPLRRTQIMATLGKRMPEPVTLMRIVLDTERPPAASLVGRDGADASGHPHKVNLELSALAPDDLTVANLLTALKEHALFDDVAMHHSRSIEQYDVAARQFRMSTTVDLDRQFEPVEDTSGASRESAGDGVDASPDGAAQKEEMVRADP